jgi:hypothetical protein
MHLQVLDFPETSSGQVFEVGKRAHFTLNPSSYINMHGGYREFCENVRYNAIKRFLMRQFEYLKNSLK